MRRGTVLLTSVKDYDRFSPSVFPGFRQAQNVSAIASLERAFTKLSQSVLRSIASRRKGDLVEA